MMPGIDGYAVYEKINNQSSDYIPFIFLTAKSEPEDFRKGMMLGADDYVIKPFKATELIKTVEVRLSKYKKIMEHSENYEQCKEQKKIDDKLLLKLKDKAQLITVNDINCIISEGEYTNVFLDNNKPILIRRVLKEWETILPEAFFIRIHRSILINVNKVKSIASGFKGTFIIQMQNYPETLVSSRRFFQKIKMKLQR